MALVVSGMTSQMSNQYLRNMSTGAIRFSIEVRVLGWI